jgi:hypothetical protein
MLKRRQKLLDCSRHGKTRGTDKYGLLEQRKHEWSREAARTYVEAWLISWHQLNKPDARAAATWYDEEVELIAAKHVLY